MYHCRICHQGHELKEDCIFCCRLEKTCERCMKITRIQSYFVQIGSHMNFLELCSECQKVVEIEMWDGSEKGFSKLTEQALRGV